MPSWRARILDRLLRRIVRNRLETLPLNAATIAASRRGMDRWGTRMPPPRGHERVQTSLGGVPTEWTRRAGDGRPVLLYCHGGAYLVGSPVPYRLLAGQLARAANCDVAVIDYRLAPEHPFPAARDDALAAYRALLDDGIPPGRIAIAGDSAGGNLAAVTLAAIRRERLPSPAASVLLSPWSDMTGSGDSVRVNAARDVMLPPTRLVDAARLYAGTRALDDPEISPLFADWQNSPPLSVHVGDAEILLDDSTRLVAHARRSGVDATVRVWPGMPHVFPAFAPMLPEGRRAIREIGAFLTEKLGAQAALRDSR
jgi:acetyl esterase/lipase